MSATTTVSARRPALLGTGVVLLVGIGFWYVLQFIGQRASTKETMNVSDDVDWRALAETKTFDHLFVVQQRVALSGYTSGSIRKVLPTRWQKLIVIDKRSVAFFDRSGTFERLVGSNGSGPGQFIEPEDIAVDEQNQVYLLDVRNSRITAYDSSGNYLNSFPLTKGAGDNILLVGQRMYLYAGFNMYLDYMGSCYELPAGTKLFDFARPTDFLVSLRANHQPSPARLGNYMAFSDGNIYVSHPYEYLARVFSPDGEEIKQIWLESSTFEAPNPARKANPAEPVEKALPSFLRNILVYRGLLFVFFVELERGTTFIDIFTLDGSRVIPNAIPLPRDLHSKYGKVSPLWTLGHNGLFYTWMYPDWDGKGTEPAPSVLQIRFVAYRTHSVP